MNVHLKSCKYLQQKHFVLFLDFILPEKKEREGESMFKWIISF